LEWISGGERVRAWPVGQGDIPKKQLDVLEQILCTLAKSRPDLVMAQMDATFQ
jgi:hypothetical protein